MPLLECRVGFCTGEPTQSDQDASLDLAPCERGGCPRSLDLDSLKTAEVRKRTLKAVQSENAAKLAALLDEAASAHHRYEEWLGRPDEDWPRWYAAYLLGGVTA